MSKRGPRQGNETVLSVLGAPPCLWSVQVCMRVPVTPAESGHRHTRRLLSCCQLARPLGRAQLGSFHLGWNMKPWSYVSWGHGWTGLGGSLPMWLQRMLACGVSASGPLCGAATIHNTGTVLLFIVSGSFMIIFNGCTCFFVLALPHDMRDLISLTRDQTWAPCSGSAVS